MLGVFAFYLMLLDSKLEKKTAIFIHNIVARFNKRITYYLGKIINFYNQSTLFSFVPQYKTQKFICAF